MNETMSAAIGCLPAYQIDENDPVFRNTVLFEHFNRLDSTPARRYIQTIDPLLSMRSDDYRGTLTKHRVEQENIARSNVWRKL